MLVDEVQFVTAHPAKSLMWIVGRIFWPSP